MTAKHLFFLLLFSLFINPVISQNSPPNILFIAIDDMNDWTGYLGGHPEAQTPNIDRLANKGTAFTRAYTAAPGCSPSRNALLYGVEPFHSGLYPFYEHDIHEQLMSKYTSLPRLLKTNGYTTLGAGKIHHGNLEDPREWDTFFKASKYKKQFVTNAGFQRGSSSKYSYRPTTHADHEHVDYQVASFGVEQLNKAHDKPFFLAVGIVKPHLPFDAPQRFFDQLPEKITPPQMIPNDMEDIPGVGKALCKRKEVNFYNENNAWNAIRRAYLACISWADYNIGRVLDALEESPYANNTIIVLWSDHGFHLGEKQTFKKFTLWEEAARVPFIIYDPRVKNSPQTCEQPVSLINIYKTISDYSGIKPPSYVDGVSLKPIISNTKNNINTPAITTWGRGNYGLRTKQYHYIRYFNGAEELYHHEDDPNEWYNLAKIPTHQKELIYFRSFLPNEEAPMVAEYSTKWSIEGADKKRR